jgi:DNA repair protein RadC
MSDCQLQFKPEIEIKYISERAVPDKQFSCSEAVAAEFLPGGSMYDLLNVPVERFYLLNLNIKNKLINFCMVSQGSLTSSIVHPREVLKAAVLSSAASVIFVHGHPSGDSEPSIDDIEITNRLCKACAIVGINVLDHLVIAVNPAPGVNGYYSFRQNNMI